MTDQAVSTDKSEIDWEMLDMITDQAVSTDKSEINREMLDMMKRYMRLATQKH